MAKALDLRKQKFGYLTALSPTDKRDKYGNIYWTCLCDNCGKRTDVTGHELKRGNRTSCGCAIGEATRKKNKTLADSLGGTNPNHYKMKIPTTNTTGVKGVSKYYIHGTFSGYRAYITFKGKSIHGGVFSSFDDAVTRRKELEEQYFDITAH